ncbi:uncharacterized protein CANTADRAFT_45988 [Suhomyces tanzawaensis NRRL Y-17324]|uniref:N-acetyltransferase domain-containing protein n=1 Tax=Suhomyces tanzawaensis NRRL Y-17324 TaxID=984487 RepID=A0A1E4SR48_9ASCO|nr:uncharacterized protein CANTADRAFT_45988 [Suhomyces tanzawaensis NRRL Y-17324]ODV81917.1 hypothetical protein CANTADRAFT_45988 [Suhomyces tanzawaensis NRRL Y-17324]
MSTQSKAYISNSTSSLVQDAHAKGIKILTHADVKKAAFCLLNSFRTDALAQLLTAHIPDQKYRDECELALYEAYVHQHITKGFCLGMNETEDTFETVAVWSTPTSVEDGLDSFPTLMSAGYGKVWDMFGPEGREKVFYGMLPLLHDSCERIISNDARFSDKDIYTLVYLGSLPSARGKGNVRKHFEFVFKNFIDKSDKNIAYLESSSPDNIPIYERFGFRFYEDIMLGDNSSKNAVEGKDYAIMNVMIRGSKGKDWQESLEKGKL